MNSIAQEAQKSKRYLPHELTTKIHAVETYRQCGDVKYICRKYHISKASLMRWNKRYDGTRESLLPKSHRPHTPHPNSHTEEELKWIKDQERFSNFLKFYSYEDLLMQMKRYLRRSNKIPMAVLGWKSPDQKHRELEQMLSLFRSHIIDKSTEIFISHDNTILLHCLRLSVIDASANKFSNQCVFGNPFHRNRNGCF